ncbi:hypothetical protein EON68_03470 [archaeon]|nr:MAG: hypothetical protein EON68_03470 [archaeon]
MRAAHCTVALCRADALALHNLAACAPPDAALAHDGLTLPHTAAASECDACTSGGDDDDAYLALERLRAVPASASATPSLPHVCDRITVLLPPLRDDVAASADGACAAAAAARAAAGEVGAQYLACMLRLSPEKEVHRFVAAVEQPVLQDTCRELGITPLLCGAAAVEGTAARALVCSRVQLRRRMLAAEHARTTTPHTRVAVQTTRRTCAVVCAPSQARKWWMAFSLRVACAASSPARC